MCSLIDHGVQSPDLAGLFDQAPKNLGDQDLNADEAGDLAAVVAVAEAGSLSEAARRRKIPLATVSRKVSELESYLETKLFNRSSRALVLTDAGRSYVAAAKRIINDMASCRSS